MKTTPQSIEQLEIRIAPAVAVFPLASVDGSNGFRINGVAARDYSGIAVSDAGDINGDGFGDLLIGASGADPNGGSSGASYVVFGKAGGFPASLDLATLDGTNGFKISGVAAFNETGSAVSAARDVNGDGFGDLLIGASKASTTGTNSGAAYVVFGKASGFTANLNLSTLDGSNGFRISGAGGGDHAGASVSAAGDVNGDGFDDVIIGAPDADPGGISSGASYVVFGKASGFTANVALSALNGSNGFIINGVAAGDLSGSSVSGAGDINGDGFADLIIGAPEAKVAGMPNGAAYVVFGKATGFSASINLATLNGSDGFKLSGAGSMDYAGHSVSAAGDVNGDGLDDLIIGAYGTDTNGSYSGTSYVVFGKTTGFSADLNLSTLNGSNGFKVNGLAASKSGFSVSDAGDFNGDGFDDLLIGTGSSYSSTIGRSYVVLGKASGFQANLNLSTLNGSNGFELSGAVTDDRSGRSVSAAGDVNGDGFGDLIVGAYSSDLNGLNSGASYVVFGSSGGSVPAVRISDVTVIEPRSGSATATFTVTLSTTSPQPVTVQYSTANGTASAGDDYTALPLSTLTFAPGETSKTVAVLVHANSPVEPDETFFVNLTTPVNATLADAQGIGTIADKSAPFQLSSLLGTNGFTIDGQAIGDRAGASVSDAGDVNGDGFGDVIVGAPGADPHGATSGASYVVFGKATGFPAHFDLATVNGINGFKISGVAADDGSGASVSSAGDINGDGFGDLIIGAPQADPNGYASGATYVIFGKASGFTANLDVSGLNGSNGFTLTGPELSRAGSSVSGLGDINGDGFDDLIVSAPLAAPNGPSSGASYVVFGKATGFAPALNLTTLDGSNGFQVSGVSQSDYSGRAVSAAGDVNGDGFDDVIIGASFADATASDSGAAYVVFGRASGFLMNLNLSALDGQNGFRLSGVASADNAGFSVSGAGDINGDGFDDVIVGAPRGDSSGAETGTTFVVFGKAGGFAADLKLSTLDGTNGFKLSGVTENDRSGHSVSAAGDFNGDGFDDIIIGAYQAAPNGMMSGSSYVVFGKATGFAANLNLSTLNGSNGIRLDGATQFTYSGISVSGAGDVNGDGFDDVIIGAADNNGANRGTSYVVFGRGVEIRISDATTIESDTGSTVLEFEVRLSEAAEIPLTVNVATEKGTAEPGNDFDALGSTTLTFAPGETTKTVSINVKGDTLFEADESFSVLLSGAKGGVIRDGTGIGTIRNNDIPPVVNITGGSVLEGNNGTSSVEFTVSLSAPSGLPATVKFETVDGTTTAGSDYTALTGTLTFAPGETTKTVTVNVLGDVDVEDHESFSILLSEAGNATIGKGTATGTILNDDGVISIADVSLREGDTGSAPFSFVVSLGKPSAIPVTVKFATADGTAIAGSDYEAAALTQLTFAPGETTKIVTIHGIGDADVEPHETFSVVLSDASGATIGADSATGTLLNDDTVVRISDASVLEGHTGTRTMMFTVNLTEESALPVAVSYASVEGTATGGVDYTVLTPGTLDFAPGETSKVIIVEVAGDTSVEASESFSVQLSNGVNAIIEDDTGVGSILDDDVTLLGKRKATFTDVDGDIVLIKVSKGTLGVENFTLLPSGLGSQLALVDFSGDEEFARATLSITAMRAPGTAKGVRSVDVGYIDATGIDLGKVVVKGDIGRIDAGDDIDPKPAIGSLSAISLGMRGVTSQLPGGSSVSQIVGALKSFKLSESMSDAVVSVSGDIGSLIIKGSMTGSSIQTDGRIGVLQISGDLGESATRGSLITAQGALSPGSAAKALAIGRLSIGGSVSNAQILAGYDRSGAATNADASIGTVTVGHEWVASDLVAGAIAGNDGFFGTEDDARIPGGTPIVAKIASIMIKGSAVGTPDETDHFGFVAEQIAAFKVAGTRLALLPKQGNDLTGHPVGTGGDLLVREIV